MEESPKPPTVDYNKYSTVTGYFEQDDPSTDDADFDYALRNFGLIDRSYKSDKDISTDHKKTLWERFDAEVSRLNRESDSKVQYKLLYVGRHGEGYHNVAEAFYGTHDWDCYWSLQDGNRTSTWADALLTYKGIEQGNKANKFWRSQINFQRTPTPELYYSSPLTRCLTTANLTFYQLDLPEDRPFTPIIKENFRECIGVHTCDRRSTKTKIRKMWPKWVFEEGFAEEDPLWEPDLRESNEAMDIRLRQALDDVFATDKTYISLSIHSAAVMSILRVIGHRDFGLGTGQIIPVLVKGETVSGVGPPREKGPYTTISTCSRPTTIPEVKA